MADLSLADKVVAVDRALTDADIPHAFGGALALAYYAEPRATIDIDVNVFVDPAQYSYVVSAVVPLGVDAAPDAERVRRDGQVRLWWGRNPLDIFFAYHALHDAMRQATRTVPFGDVDIPILAPEHLIVVKVVFNRAKDWLDIEQMLSVVPGLDIADVSRWLDAIIGPEDDRAQRFRALANRLLGSA